ncbi:ABC transporter substrate-binding protein [Halocatena marina]|uniref:ABC transporter substrate-binding protein n=1 Tax=Halocatena marina TaxID=2934937 RepID=A0ABD5YQ52_9EURY|nr:ABC transporter substrate-binding protein [Halocatena marina]
MANSTRSADGDSNESPLTRRRWLALCSGAAMAGLAGCGANPDDPNATLSSESTGSEGGSNSNAVTTELHMRAPVSWTPSDSNVNPFSTQGDIEYWMEYMWWESPSYPNAVGEPIYWLAKDISVQGGGCEVLITLDENHTWWDGSPVTAKDYHTTQLITDYKEYGGPDETDDGWEVVDKYKIKNVLSGPANPAVKKVDYYTPVAKHDYYKSWLEKFEDASGEQAIKGVAKELNDHTVTLKDLTDKGLGCGLWKPAQLSPTNAVHEKYQDHPRADWTNLETFNWHLLSEKQKAIQALNTGKLDFGDKLTDQARTNDQTEVFSRFGMSGVPKLTMNWNNEHLARRPVRRAIAYLIDSEEVVKVIKSAHGIKYNSRKTVFGMSSSLISDWVSDGFVDKLIDYGSTSKPEKAASVLKKAGYSKNGGVWVGPNGSKVSGLTYLTPPWNIYKSVGKYFSSKLDEFGFKNNLVVPSGSGFYKRWDETYDFDLCNWFTTGSHPAYAYSTVEVSGLGNYDEIAVAMEKTEGCTVNRTEPELDQPTSEKLQHPIRPKFPKQIGQKSLNSGAGQTLYPLKWHKIMLQTQDTQEVKQLTEKLAWYVNWQVPHVGFYDEVKVYWGNTNKFDFPSLKADDHPHAEETKAEHRTTAMEFLMKGHISAKTK